MHWQAQFVDRQVQEVLKGLFLPETPISSFVSLADQASLADLTDEVMFLQACAESVPRFDFPGACTSMRI